MTYTPDDEKLAELRANVGKAVQAFFEYQQELFWNSPNLYVMGWVVSLEASSPELESEESSQRGVITPDGQMAATSLGLLHGGIAHWHKQ